MEKAETLPQVGHGDLTELMAYLGESFELMSSERIPAPLCYQMHRHVKRGRELLKRLTPETVPSD